MANISLPIDIRFRPAYHKLTEGKRKKDIRVARNQAVKHAWVKLWAFWGPKLAKKTGRFRMAVFGMIQSQMAKTRLSKFTIRFMDVSGPLWAKYHIFGPEGEALDTRPYKHPTTPNTKPLNEFNFMDKFEDFIIAQMPIEFNLIHKKKWKPKWKQYVKVL